MLETDKRKRSILAAKLANTPDILLTTILIGNNIVNLSASALTTTLALSIWGNKAISLATGVLTFLILIFGEIVPKQLAITYNTRVARFCAYPIRILTIILYPLVKVIQFLSSLITSLFNHEKEGSLSLEALMHVVDVAENEGIVDEYETSLFQKVLHFSEASVKTVMTHRTDVFSLSDELSLRESYASIINSGYSRIPIFHESVENIVGIVLIRDLLLAQFENRSDEPLSAFQYDAVYVPETRKVNDMLTQFQHDQLQIAIVLDEYGGLSGVVTLEDIIEQLFGEIYDEHETGHHLRIQEDSPGIFNIKADTSLQEINDELDLHIEREDLSKTLAAFLIEQLGAIPTKGETVEVSFGIFTITQMHKKRIEWARLAIKSQ
jgi:CBS domain containing-hemolysin-like protein